MAKNTDSYQYQEQEILNRVFDPDLNTLATASTGGSDATAANQTSQISEAQTTNTRVGDVTEAVPGSDTASSGLNGRLQRIAQRLTSLIALLPGSLGQKARAASLAVTLSSEDVTTLTPPAAITGYATSAKQDTLAGKIPDQEGTWGYNAGTSGTLTLTGSKRVLLISAIAQEASATITINSGDSITLPYGSTDKASSAIEIVPKGNLIDPTIVFTGTKAYFCEYVV